MGKYIRWHRFGFLYQRIGACSMLEFRGMVIYQRVGIVIQLFSLPAFRVY